jgi:hypothetical protein
MVESAEIWFFVMLGIAAMSTVTSWIAFARLSMTRIG